MALKLAQFDLLWSDTHKKPILLLEGFFGPEDLQTMADHDLENSPITTSDGRLVGLMHVGWPAEDFPEAPRRHAGHLTQWLP